MTLKQQKEAIEILKDIHLDAKMALNGEWDKSDEGFEAQQIVIERFFESIGEELE